MMNAEAFSVFESIVCEQGGKMVLYPVIEIPVTTDILCVSPCVCVCV